MFKILTLALVLTVATSSADIISNGDVNAYEGLYHVAYVWPKPRKYPQCYRYFFNKPTVTAGTVLTCECSRQNANIGYLTWGNVESRKEYYVHLVSTSEEAKQALDDDCKCSEKHDRIVLRGVSPERKEFLVYKKNSNNKVKTFLFTKDKYPEFAVKNITDSLDDLKDKKGQFVCTLDFF